MGTDLQSSGLLDSLPLLPLFGPKSCMVQITQTVRRSKVRPQTAARFGPSGTLLLQEVGGCEKPPATKYLPSHTFHNEGLIASGAVMDQMEANKMSALYKDWDHDRCKYVSTS